MSDPDPQTTSAPTGLRRAAPEPSGWRAVIAVAVTIAGIAAAGLIAYYVLLPFPVLSAVCGYLIGAAGLAGAVLSIFTPRRLPRGKRILYAVGGMFVSVVSLALSMGAFPQ